MTEMPLTRAGDFPDVLRPFLGVGTARPETWGPPMWDTLIHMLNGVGTPTQASFEDGQVVFVMTEAEAAQLRDRLRVFGQLLPCPRCAHHFSQAIDAVDVSQAVMQTRAGWLDWLTRQKDKVNALSGKPTHGPQARAQFCRDVITLTGSELWLKRAAEKKNGRCTSPVAAPSRQHVRPEPAGHQERGAGRRKESFLRTPAGIFFFVVAVAVVAAILFQVLPQVIPRSWRSKSESVSDLPSTRRRPPGSNLDIRA